MKYILITLSILLVAIAVIAGLPYFSKQQLLITNHTGFTIGNVGLTNYNINDVGTTDFNNDGNLDLFTVNHSATQNLLEGDGKGNFNDIFLTSGLEQAEGFPGAGNSDISPEISDPGFYIFRKNRILHLENHLSKNTDVVKGSLEVGWPIFVKQCEKCNHTITETKNAFGLLESRLEYEIQKDGKLLINGKSDIVELPHAVNLESNTLLSTVFIGHEFISPATNSFELQWRDRHGMAWLDYNNDGRPDVYIARGGVKGMAGTLSTKIQDELFIQNDNQTFSRHNELLSNLSHDCPGRKVNWVDMNVDLLLDLYIVCGRDATEPHVNRVVLQGTSIEEATDFANEKGLNFGFLSDFVLLDTDLDADLDLFSIEGGVVNVYQNNSGQYSATTLKSKKLSRVQKITHADFDNDGDTDVFVASKSENVLFKNQDNSFIAVDPTTIGLPRKSHTANWIDYNNDGYLDLHTLPDGLFVQTEAGSFNATSILSFTKPEKLTSAICNWFDLNNDGARDAVCVAQIYPHRIEAAVRKYLFNDPGYTYWRTYSYLNTNDSNNWLQTKLGGPEHNTAAVGSSITVYADGKTYFAQLGESEGSRFSQGHYRNYFGLNKYDGSIKLKVDWFDGTEKILEIEDSNRIVNINYP